MELSIADIANGMAQGQIELTGVATSAERRGRHLDAGRPRLRRWPLDRGPGRQPAAAQGRAGADIRAARRLPVPVLPLRVVDDRAAARSRAGAGRRRSGVPRPDRRRGGRHAARVACSGCRWRWTWSPASTRSRRSTSPSRSCSSTGWRWTSRAPGRAARSSPADEWWLATEPGETTAVAAALRSAPISANDVVDRTAVDRRPRRRPARPRRHRHPRARLARRAGLRLDRVPRQRDGVDLGADRRVRAAQGAGTRAPAAPRCGCRSRT